jgi:hypothetical protein
MWITQNESPRKLLATILVVVLFGIQFAPVVPVSAYTGPDKEATPDKQLQRTMAYMFMFCATGASDGDYASILRDDTEGTRWLRQDMSPDEAGSGNIWTTDATGSVGHEVEPEDGKMSCGNSTERKRIVETTAQMLGHSDVDAFIRAYYERVDGRWQPKGNLVEELITAVDNITYGAANDPESNIELGAKERERRALVAFARCFRPKADSLKPPVTVDGKEYVYRDDKDAGDTIAVGQDWQKDGEMRCDTLARITKVPDDVDINALWSNPQLLIQSGENSEEASKVTFAGGFGPAGDGTETCESVTDNDFGWILCIGIGLVDDTFASMQDAVDDLLEVSENEFDSPELKAVWSYFKNVATFLLILVGLVMIIGQAVSRE